MKPDGAAVAESDVLFELGGEKGSAIITEGIS